MQTAKLFKNGRTQAVRLPKEFQLPGKEVYIRKDGARVVLTPKDVVWDEFLKSMGAMGPDFLNPRAQGPEQERDFGGLY